MAIKTAAEMFGDGSGGNPQVPIDTGNPPGFNANNRGVAFGEQVTSAIKNRTPYALVLNDEDLNARLADFEVGGLDSAYDLGTIGPAGGGRQITKDAGAVETVSALLTAYADDPTNAHFRANMLGDSIGGSVGFDSPQDLANQFGFLSRKVQTFTGNTIWSPGQSATLNVGGANPNGVTIGGGGQFRTAGGITDLNSYDLMLIEGTAGSDGLYVIFDPAVSQFVAEVRGLDGSIPVFVADEACTITCYRANFITTRPGSGSPDSGVLVSGLTGDRTAMTVVAGRSRTDRTGGAERMVEFLFPNDAGGLLNIGSYIDAYGRHILADSSFPHDLAGLSPIELFGNDYLTKVTHPFPSSGTPHVAHWVEGDDFISNDHAYMYLDEPRDPAGQGILNFDFLGVAGDIEIQDGGYADNNITRVSGIVQILTPAAQAGYYQIYTKQSGGVQSPMTLRRLNGAVTSGFPTVGSGTCRIWNFNGIGRVERRTNTNTGLGSLLPGTSDDSVFGSIFSAPDEQGVEEGVAIGMTAAPGGYFFKAIEAADQLIAAGESDNTSAYMDSTGFFGCRGIRSEGNITVDGEFNYVSPEDYEIWIPATAALQTSGQTDLDHKWYFQVSGVSPTQGARLTSLKNFARLVWDLNLLFPSGSVINAIYCVVQPGAARAGGNRMTLAYHEGTVTNFLTPSAVAFAGPFEDNGAVGREEDNGNNTLQSIALTGLSITIDKSAPSNNVTGKYLELIAGNDAGTNRDDVMGCLFDVDLPGARNH